MLLEHPGDVVLRDEIRQKLWPDDTVVEFDRSINAVIQKLRDALGESADDPRYIETLPRRGYRFVGTVETFPPEAATELPVIDTVVIKVAPRDWSSLIAAMALILLSALAVAGWLRPWEPRALARNLVFSLGPYKAGVLMSPDGSSVLYFSILRAFQLRRLDSLEDIPIYAGGHFSGPPAWSPDSSQVMLQVSTGLVRVRVPAGPPEIICSKIMASRGSSWRPDGFILVASSSGDGHTELDLVPAKGGDPVRVELPGFVNGWFTAPKLLPDGKNFLFTWGGFSDEEVGVYLATLEHGKITRAPILLRKNQTAGHYSASVGGNCCTCEMTRFTRKN
jgi:hypothetical protein